MTEAYENALERAVVQLQAARQILLEDIASYPTPISGCDAQFNVLLSDRTRISNALEALEHKPFIATPRVLRQGGVSESR